MKQHDLSGPTFTPTSFALVACLVTMATLLWPHANASGQPLPRIPRVAFLSGTAPPSGADWKEKVPAYVALRELGWEEGRNVAFEWRWAEGQLERLPGMAAELVGQRVDVIVTNSYKPGQVAAEATQSIPIVVVTCDPYQWLVGSLARPGGNVTGQTCMSAELAPKKLELLKQIAPGITHVAFVYNPDDPGPTLARQLVEVAARDLGLKLTPVTIRSASEVDRALADVVKASPDGMFVYPDSVTARVHQRFIAVADQRRLPAMYGFAYWVRAGGLISYGANLADMSKRAMVQVDRILKGAKPADLPIEQPAKFELVINLKTANAQGFAIPPGVLVRADEVIR